jgi:hypothetical protein
MLVLATMELVAHDMHAYEMHAYKMPVREARRESTPIRDARPRETSVGMLVASHIPTPPNAQDQEAITAFMPFFRFLDLLTELRHEVYKLHFLEIPRVVNLGFRS